MDFIQLLFENLDNILNVWMIIDSDKKIVHWSKTAGQQFGYSDHEIINQHFNLLLPGPEEIKNLFWKKIILDDFAGTVINQSSVLKQKNNVLIDVEISFYSLQQNDSNYHLVSLDNITEEVELQQLVNIKMQQLSEQFHTFEDEHLDRTILDILDAVLVSITAGQGLKFNRCFILFVDSEKDQIRGVKAIGPGSGEEAGMIYSKFDYAPKTLTEMIDQYQNLKENKDYTVNKLVHNINISRNDKNHILNQALASQSYILVNDYSKEINDSSFNWLRETLGVSECIIVPLIWHAKPIGLIIADNQVTKTPITNLDIKGITRFAKTAVNVIESVRLLIKLEESINHIKQANLKIRESQTIIVQKEKLAAKGELIAQMAHEVRGPLVIIGGFARRIFKNLNQTDKNYDSINRIIETVNTLELVINDILHSNNDKSVSRKGDIAKVINKVIGLLEEEINTRKISVNMNIQGNLRIIKAKEHYLFEIINNIIKNAIEAIESDGLLIIIVSQLQESISVTIQDTGPGIPLKDFDYIFTPFFTTKKEGTGLGLVIVKKLIEENEGTFKVSSIPNKGTTFRITFPTESTNEET